MIVRHKVYHRLDYHLVFVTKFREGFLTREVLSRFEALCQKKANELGFIMHISNGYLDHVHLLVSLKPQLPPYKYAQPSSTGLFTLLLGITKLNLS